jgi:dTDP-4-dehydrorhamnose 3,5-epimerase
MFSRKRATCERTMEFKETRLRGAFLVGIKKIVDDRGFFARGWCRDEFGKLGLNPDATQLNIGFSHKKGTLRGMHYQKAPHAEAKLVRCTRGAVFDVIIDLRPYSVTRGEWYGVELTQDNHLSLYAPEGFAHGYQTLSDDAEIYYLTTAMYAAAAATGVRYDDPAFAIQWPLEVSLISDSDRTWPAFGS